MLLNFLIGLYVVATSAALVLLKLSSKDGPLLEITNGKLDLNITTYAIFGITLYGFSFLLYIYLIAKFDLGYIIPLTTALVYVLIFFSSYAVFKESFTILKVMGILLIFIGIVFLNFKK